MCNLLTVSGEVSHKPETESENMTNEEFAVRYEVTPDKFTKDEAISLIVRLFAVLNGALERVRKVRSTATVGVKKAVEMVSQNKETVSLASEVADKVRTVVFEAIEQNHDLALLLPDHFGFIVDEIRDVRALVMEGLDIEDDDEETEDVSEDVEVARLASDSIRNFSTLLGMHGLSLEDLPGIMLRKNKKNEVALSLPKVPSIGNEDKVPTTGGKPLSGSQFRYRLNGQEVKVTGFNRLATFHCSTHTLRINGSELRDLIKRQTGKEWSDPSNSKFTIKVPAGTLEGELIKK